MTSPTSYYSTAPTEPLVDVTSTFTSDTFTDEDETTNKKYCWICSKRQMIACGICITIGCIIAVILFLVTWFVIVPLVTQKQVDQASITFDRMALSQPNGTSFTIEVLGSLQSKSPFNAQIDSTTMGLYFTYSPSVSAAQRQRRSISSSTPSPSNTSQATVSAHIGAVDFPALYLNDQDSSVIIDTVTRFEVLDSDGFEAFMVDLVHSNSTTLRLRGDVVVHIHLTSWLTISVPDIHIDKEASVQGMHGLTDADLSVISVDVVGGDAASVWLLPVLTVNDTSDIELDMSPVGVTLNLIYQLAGVGDIVLANGTVSNFVLKKGTSQLSTLIKVYKQPDHPELVGHLLADYLAGIDTPLLVTGSPNAVPAFPYMNAVLSSLLLPSVLPGINITLIQHAYVFLGAQLGSLDVELVVTNIWNCTFAITGASIVVSWRGTDAGVVTIPVLPTPIVALPFETITSVKVPVTVTLSIFSPVFLDLIATLLSGQLQLDVAGNLTAAIYGPGPEPYRDVVAYKQSGINSTVGL